MTEPAYSPEIRKTAHELYRFLQGRSLEGHALTTTDVRTQMALLGVTDSDMEGILRTCMAEAQYWVHEEPLRTADDVDYSMPSCAMDIDVAIKDTYGELLDETVAGWS